MLCSFSKRLTVFSKMRRASILQAVLLSVATLQLQSASGSPMTWAKPVRVQALFTSDIVEKAENYVKVRIAIERLEIGMIIVSYMQYAYEQCHLFLN